MRYIKTYEGLFDLFKNKKDVEKTPEEKQKDLMNKFLVNCDYKVNYDMSVDVWGDVIKSETCKEFPIKFNVVNGNFIFSYIKLESLRLGPKRVTGNFDCSYNYLRTLEGAPEYVGGDFLVRSLGHLSNSVFCLKTLEGCPKQVGGDIDFTGYAIYTFEFFPEILGGDIICKDTPISYIWKMFQDKTMIEAFNAYDPIKPPENDGKYPILYIDILEMFLDNLDKITDENIIRDLDQNAMVYSQKIMNWYDVRISSNDKTISSSKPLVKLFMKLVGTLPENN